MEETVQKFIDLTLHDPYHRYKSWEHCYTAYGNKNESTTLLIIKNNGI